MQIAFLLQLAFRLVDDNLVSVLFHPIGNYTKIRCSIPAERDGARHTAAINLIAFT